MDLGLAGKVALIAGASHGIGHATALVLAEESCSLVLAARGQDALRQAASEVEAKGAEALAVPCDLTIASDAERLVESALGRFDRIDILINSIHFSAPGDADEVWRQSFDILFLPAARLTRLVTPHMREGGSIIHLSSIYGREAGGRPGYNAMKAALISHAKAMAIELAPHNIRVNTVAPGSISHPRRHLVEATAGGPGGHGQLREREHPSGPLRHSGGGRERDRFRLLRARLLGHRRHDRRRRRPGTQQHLEAPGLSS